MGFTKRQPDEEGPECAECGTMTSAGDEGGWYCASCETTMYETCGSCGGAFNGESATCMACFEDVLNSDHTREAHAKRLQQA